MNTFFLVAIPIYIVINIYIFIRGWQAMPPIFAYRFIFIILFLFVSSMYLNTMQWINTLPVGLLKVFYTIGATWLICMVYYLLLLLPTDIIALLNRWLHFLPDNITVHFRQIQFYGISAIIVVLLFYGYYKFSNPSVNTCEITINKKAGDRKELRIVGLSDLHLGLLVDKKLLSKYVDKINVLNPDMIMIAGDVIDNSIRPLNVERMEEELNRLNAPLGIYMCLGNHEYFSGIHNSLDFLKRTKINLLADSVAYVDNSFWIVGREDRIIGDRRRPLADLIAETNQVSPVFLLDHQPFHLDDAEKNGVDFQFSGHTHNGQIWPGNLIVKRMYEVGHGYKRKGNLHVYVSSGLGLWGPLLRIGTESEIVVFNIKFD